MAPVTARASVVVCGETVVDLVQAGPRTWVSHPGGSPANVAVGLARLEVPVALLARLSDDAFGRMLRAHLSDARVDLGLCPAATQPSTLAVASLDEAGVATYDFWVDGTADWQWSDDELPERLPGSVRALHTGSMVLEVEPGATRVRALLERVRGQVLVSYDPNVRLARRGDRAQGLAAVERVVGLAGLVKVSSEDLAWLLPGTPVEDVLHRWRGLGPSLVVVTLGGEGALGLAGGDVLRVPVPPVDVVDTVGAGDAFSAALLAGLADAGLLDRAALAAASDDVLRPVLELAARCASLTCTRPGADPPTRAELQAALG